MYFKRRNLIYHIYPSKASEQCWMANVRELMKRISLFNGRKTVAVALDDHTSSLAEVKHAFGGTQDIDFQVFCNNPDLGEMVTFRSLLSTVCDDRDPTTATFYSHAKGMRRWGDPFYWRWTQIMYWSMLDYFPLVDEHLRQVPFVGTFVVGSGYPMKTVLSPWHIAGTFYWFRNQDVFSSRKWADVPNVWGASEAWPSVVEPDQTKARGLLQHDTQPCRETFGHKFTNFMALRDEFQQKYKGKYMIKYVSYPDAGIVTMGGGRYMPYVYCMIKLLRLVGCDLPILCGYMGKDEELPARLADDMDCDFIDVTTLKRRGWGAKAACCLASKFRHVIWNDADAFWMNDGTWMFDSPEYVDNGALFWNDRENIKNTPLWKVAGVPFSPVPFVSGGTLFIDRNKHEEALQKVDALCGHKCWDYIRDNDMAAWYLGWAGTGHRFFRVPYPSVFAGRALLFHDLLGAPWVYHITREAKAKIKLLFSVKQHPNCHDIREFIGQYNKLSRGTPS